MTTIKKLEDLVSPYLGENKKIVDKKITNLTAPGDNFGSVMLKVDLKLNNGEDLHLVAKLLPDNEYFQLIFNSFVTFKNEIAFYDRVVPAMQSFQRKQGVEEVIGFFPKLYGARLNLDADDDRVDENGVFLLENLVVQGFQNVDRYDGFGLEISKLVVKDAARFHAISLAMKHSEPEIFEKQIKPYAACFSPYTPLELDGYIQKTVLEVIKECPECENVVPDIKQFFKYFKKFPEEPREPFSVIVHKDLWLNNIMVAFREEVPLECKYVDLQMFTYDNPTIDLIFFLASSVRLEILKEHLDDLLELYYESLVQNLKLLKCDDSLISQLTYERYLQEFSAGVKQEMGRCVFSILFIVYGPKKELDAMDGNISGQPKMPSSNQIPIEAKRKVWWILKEFHKRRWL